ncbi:MAG: cyclic nucleotide-binding domain-containing protein [Mariprofundaceae bacterium]|nr:cyclic nucleotide-binding domain-containing protein [Mariprofundaceae bacterium]
MTYAPADQTEQNASTAFENIFTLFKTLDISKHMSELDLKLIFKHMTIHQYQKGEIIYSAGHDSKGELSLIISGQVSALDQSGHQYTTLSSGDVFGLFSFLDDERIHSATVRSDSDLQVVKLSRASFDRIASFQPMLENLLLHFMFQLLSKTTLKIENEYAAMHEYALGRKV